MRYVASSVASLVVGASVAAVALFVLAAVVEAVLVAREAS